jgi:hypothetical protein
MTTPQPPAALEMSRRGWVSVNYNMAAWIPCPLVFPEGEDRQSWGLLFAREWWARSGREHGDLEVRALARTLEEIHQTAYAGLAMHDAFIHLPDLRLVPLLVGLGIWAADGERDAQLRALTRAQAPETLRPPQVEEFRAARMGTGLKALSFAEHGEMVIGFLSYAWRSEEHATAVRLFTACPDLGRLHRAIPDIEELANGMTIISRDSLESSK